VIPGALVPGAAGRAGGLGKLFGPVMVVWFVVILRLGCASSSVRPEILGALSPVHGVRFSRTNRLAPASRVLGGVVLAVTGRRGALNATWPLRRGRSRCVAGC